MPMQRITVRPGVDVEASPTANRGGWSASNLIRWRSGFVEQLLGWLQVLIAPSPLTGICRALHPWTDLTSSFWIAAGTNTKLGVFLTATTVPSGHITGDIHDITPTLNFTPGSASSGGMPYSLLIWSLDNFGQNLIAVPSGQGIFQWIPPDYTVHASLVAQAPPHNQGAYVSMPIQILVAYGSCLDLATVEDPLLVRWCTDSDYTVWTPSTTNQAGSYRLPRGNRIISAMQVASVSVIWTDLDIWTVQYIGFPLVYSFLQAGEMCGLISQKAAVALGSVIYWMSDHGFFRMVGGGVQQIPCSVWDIVYTNLDHNNQDKCVAGADYHYNEIWFFFPSASGGSGEIDSYVKFNLLDNAWDYGPANGAAPNAMARTSWTDQNQSGPPICFDVPQMMQQQDIGYTANGTPLLSSIRTGYQDIADGGGELLIDQFVPDFLWGGNTPSLSITFYFIDWPGDTPTVIGPFTIVPTTEFVTIRLPRTVTIGTTTFTAYPAVRAKQVALQIDGISGWWRFGASRFRGAPSGSI